MELLSLKPQDKRDVQSLDTWKHRRYYMLVRLSITVRKDVRQMKIADSGTLTIDDLPGFQQRLQRLLGGAPFAYIASTAQLFDECVLVGVYISSPSAREPAISMRERRYGTIFTLSVPAPGTRSGLYVNIRYTFRARSLQITAVPRDNPRDLQRFYFIGR
jgi:hypothetical protein